MNETANATLALGALPVMAHAPEEVEEMVGLAGALVLNIGTLSRALGRGDARSPAGRRTRAACRSCSTRSAPARRAYRTETARRILDEVDVAVLRGNAGEVATLVGVEAEVRGVESIGARRRSGRARPRGGALARRRRLGDRARSTTSPTASGVLAIANGDPLLASITGTGCMSSAITGCFLAVGRLAARRGGRGARRVRRRRRGRGARTRRGPGSFHVALYDALAALDPATLDGRARVA